VQPDQFRNRLDAVRHRFASSLQSKIEDTIAALPRMCGDGDKVVDAVEASYRRIHGICGVGATVGFAVTGRAAKRAEDALVAAYRGRRGLAAEELLRLEKALDALSAAAASELRSVAAAPSTSRE
jgi:chemotaxis protein histidine kinase CheA